MKYMVINCNLYVSIIYFILDGRCKKLSVCPRGSCYGDSVPIGWFEHTNCCQELDSLCEWVIIHELQNCRDVYEPCKGKLCFMRQNIDINVDINNV